MFLSKKTKYEKIRDSERVHASTYSLRYFHERVPKHEMREEGMPTDAAYQLVHDELNLDGNPSLNVASFVTTWMEPEARKIIDENLHKKTRRSMKSWTKTRRKKPDNCRLEKF